MSERNLKSNRLPREVWIATFQGDANGTTYQEKVRNMVKRMEAAIPFQPDIICLSEVFPFVGLPGGRPPLEEVAETPIGPVCKPFAQFAAQNSCYVFCPIYTRENGRFYNALVLIDRKGELVGEYRKMHPTIGEMERGISPGTLEPPVFHTDFGAVGAQICYDIEWDDGWQWLRKAGAEIVLWSSAFGGGQALNAIAQLNKYCIVSSTRKSTSKIIDMTGQDIEWTGIWKNWACASINLERAFIHTWPFVRRFGDVEAKYGPAIRITTFHEEEWSIIESRSPGVKVADVLREFEILTYDELITSSQLMQDKRRP
jgi:predicted amidohydrolase